MIGIVRGVMVFIMCACVCACVCLLVCRQILQAYTAATVSATVVAIGLNALAKVGSLALQCPFREHNFDMVFSRLHESNLTVQRYSLLGVLPSRLKRCVEMCAVKQRFSLRMYT